MEFISGIAVPAQVAQRLIGGNTAGAGRLRSRRTNQCDALWRARYGQGGAGPRLHQAFFGTLLPRAVHAEPPAGDLRRQSCP